MLTSREELGKLVAAHRNDRHWSQDHVAANCGAKTNRSAVAHLEQGIRLPKPDVLEQICAFLQIPRDYWVPFTKEESLQRFYFEEALSELVGYQVSLDHLVASSVSAVEQQIQELFASTLSPNQTLDQINSILVYYGVSRMSVALFEKYFGPSSFVSTATFESAVNYYQKDAMRLFSTLSEAYRVLNSVNLGAFSKALEQKSLSSFHDRSDWKAVETIPDNRLSDLGYISAATARQQEKERQVLSKFLLDLAKDIRENGHSAVDKKGEKLRRRMDSLLRKFDSKLPHGLYSPLFTPDTDALEREAARIAPKDETELARIEDTQEIALRNLSSYLTADYMDVYVATSMRDFADFASVNQFIRNLFSHDSVRSLKLRYFNPTQSWIEDRIAKGLVEALMLRRSSMTIYMAQKSDTFGKDSEASVSLGQGKPVIVHVPKLSAGELGADSEQLFLKDRKELEQIIRAEMQDGDDIDDDLDNESLVARIVTHRLNQGSDEQLAEIAASHWAEFDLLSEDKRIGDDSERASFRAWIDGVVNGRKASPIPIDVKKHLIGMLVAVAILFEKSAKLFREVHPLALQVILSTGVLNGILVVRTVDQCARVMRSIIENQLRLRLTKDEKNYRLVEEITGSIIRVVSRNRLLRNSFEAFYSAGNLTHLGSL